MPSDVRWDHFVGILRDAEGARLGFQVTNFYAGRNSHRHVAILDGEKRHVFLGGPSGKAEMPESDGEAGVVFAGGQLLKWRFAPYGRAFRHGQDGEVLRYGLRCFHESQPQTWAELRLFHNGQQRLFTGIVWRDSEEVPVDAVRGWRWLGLTFADPARGAFMLYAPAGEAAWGAMMGPGGYKRLSADSFSLEPTDTYRSERSGREYGCGWKLFLRDEQHRIRPLRRDQEITDAATGSYWEGACDVFSPSGARTGTAFYEEVNRG